MGARTWEAGGSGQGHGSIDVEEASVHASSSRGSCEAEVAHKGGRALLPRGLAAALLSLVCLAQLLGRGAAQNVTIPYIAGLWLFVSCAMPTLRDSCPLYLSFSLPLSQLHPPLSGQPRINCISQSLLLSFSFSLSFPASFLLKICLLLFVPFFLSLSALPSPPHLMTAPCKLLPHPPPGNLAPNVPLQPSLTLLRRNTHMTRCSGPSTTR